MMPSFNLPARALMLISLLMMGAAPVWAQTVNINPGFWEYTNVIDFGGTIPSQTQVFEDCLTEDEIKEGSIFLQDIEACEITTQDLRRDGLRYVMNCEGPEGTTLDIDARINFSGDQADGIINNTVSTPIGAMDLVVSLTAKRVGDCSEEDESLGEPVDTETPPEVEG